MDQLSILLQEAKPLYFKRKKVYRQIKMGVASCAVICLVLVQPLYVNRYRSDTSTETLYMCLYDDATFENAFSIPSSQIDYLSVDI